MKPLNYLFLASILLMTACAAPKNLEFKGIESLKIEKASLGKNIFMASFAYHNPNNFKLVLNKLDCSIYMNDQFFTKYTIDSNYTIPANANFSLPAKMEVDLSLLLKNSVDILFNKPMKIGIKGSATISKGMFTKTVPIEFETSQKLNLREAIMK
ncbi:MAG: LEA type 2 family protein [Chitinophagaceae bacterium]|nr:LEA type 2 family protein [Chitinophagaceae bacterium]